MFFYVKSNMLVEYDDNIEKGKRELVVFELFYLDNDYKEVVIGIVFDVNFRIEVFSVFKVEVSVVEDVVRILLFVVVTKFL